MNSVYDAKNPAPGVVVAPCPHEPAKGLSSSQAKGLRQYELGVVNHHAKCQPMRLDVLSAAREANRAGPIVATHGPGVRPAKRRRSPKMGTTSLCHTSGNRDFELEASRKRSASKRADKARRRGNLLRRAKAAIRQGNRGALTRAVRCIMRECPGQVGVLRGYAAQVNGDKQAR